MDYDFNKLSPLEFENFSKDIVEVKFKQQKFVFESFSCGKDNGMDFRYTKCFDINGVSKRSVVILQCKRYQQFNNLYSCLKRELDKVTKLNPERYLLTISIDLTPEQKNKIYYLFKDFMIDTSDIFTRKDLNSVLSFSPHIEEKYYKLWLSSTEMLKKIFHSRIINYSKYEFSQIQKSVELYVVNESLIKAVNILERNKFVLISGIPGVGKTTLARILVMKYLKAGYSDFIYISKDISEAFELYREERSQIFYFDDFLGSNFHVKLLSKNEDKRLVDFIQLVKSDKNKRLILTSREYIYKQAKIYYEILNYCFDPARFIINLDYFRYEIKAEILYNHLFFSDIPVEFVEEIVSNNRFLEIISSPNFNPRIIEFVASVRFIKDIDKEEYFSKILQTLRNPKIIWEKAFRNEIRKETRIVLVLNFLSGESLSKPELYSLYCNFAKKISHTELNIDRQHFEECLDEAIETFLYHSNKNFKFINPSVKDYLICYLKENELLVEDLINGIENLEYILFAFFPYDHFHIEGAVMLSEALSNKLAIRIIKDFSCFVKLHPESMGDSKIINYLSLLCERFELTRYCDIKDLVIKQISSIEPQWLPNNDEKLEYVKILNILRTEFESIDFSSLFKLFSYEIVDIYDLIYFSYFKDIMESEFVQFVNANESFYWSIYKIVNNTYTQFSGSPRELLISINRIECAYKVHFGILKSTIYGMYYNEDDEVLISEYKPDILYNGIEKQIASVFSTLLKHNSYS